MHNSKPDISRNSMQKASGLSRSRQASEWIWAWVFVLPTIAGLVILNIIPMFRSLYMSFFKAGDFGRGNIYVGLENYITMIEDVQVWGAVANTLTYTAIVVPAAIIIALIVAVMLNGSIVGRSAFRTIFFVPMVATPAAITMVWRWLYNGKFGLVNYVLNGLGLQSVEWTTDPSVALISISIIGIWSTIGYNMVLFLAGLQEIPRDFYEACDIDGGGIFRKFFKITLPLVSPTMFFVTVTSIIQAMQVFDVIYMMIEVANPAYDNTVSLVYLFYNNSFRYSNKGYGSAIVMLLLGIILLVTAIQMLIQKKWVNYD